WVQLFRGSPLLRWSPEVIAYMGKTRSAPAQNNSAVHVSLAALIHAEQCPGGQFSSVAIHILPLAQTTRFRTVRQSQQNSSWLQATRVGDVKSDQRKGRISSPSYCCKNNSISKDTNHTLALRISAGTPLSLAYIHKTEQIDSRSGKIADPYWAQDFGGNL